MDSICISLLVLTLLAHGIHGQMVGTKPTTTIATPSCLTEAELISTMEKLFEKYLRPISAQLTNIEERLDSESTCNQLGPSELFLGIYENLTIFDDWLEIYNEPYSQSLSSDQLKEIARQCRSNRVVVGAMNGQNNNILSVAAVGPKRVLALNNTSGEPEEIENVLWHLESGRTFGFRPVENDENAAPRSELFLSWNIDVNYGGWRAGKQTNLYQNSIWRKVIYCMPTF